MAAKKSKNARQRTTQRATGSRGARVGSSSELPGPSTQTATRRRVSSVSSSSGTRAEQTNTREQPPREQRIAGLAGQLDRIVDDIGVLNDELETKETEFGALAFIVRAMPKKRKRAVESPTSYEDVFERIKFPGYVKPAQKELILAAISTVLGRDRKCFGANLRGNQREEFKRLARTFIKDINADTL